MVLCYTQDIEEYYNYKCLFSTKIFIYDEFPIDITIYKITNNFFIFMELKFLLNQMIIYILKMNSVIQDVMLYLYLHQYFYDT